MLRAPFRQAAGRLVGSSRWSRFGGPLGAIAVLAAAIGIVVGGLPGSSQGASTPAKASGATSIQRRNLVATDTESGTLGYANPQTVFNRLSGTITSVPAVGAVVKPGQTMYDVDGQPVVLFDGNVPAYRDLSDGVTDGLDVQELKQNLKALGFDPSHQITVNQTFDAATTTAVELWQASLGQTQTGTVTLGQIVFLPGSQRVTAVDTVLGSTGGASGASGSASPSSGSGSASSASTSAARPATEFVSLTTTTATSPTTTAAIAATAPGTATSPPASATSSSTTAEAKSSTPCTTPGVLTQPSTGTTTTPQTTTPQPSNCDQEPVKPPTTGKKTPSQEAVLLALLKAETLELKKTLSQSGQSSSSRSSGASSSATSSAGRGGGGASSSAVSAGGSSSGGGASSSGGSSSGSGSSSAGSTAQAILQTTSNQLVVTVQLDATKQSEAVVGEPVTVEMPNGNTVSARITQVSSIAQSTSSSSSSGSGGGASSTPSATVPVTITLKGRRPVSGLDQAAVSVNFEQQVEKNVLSVPVTALLATAGGGYAVQEAVAPRRLIPVTPGLFAAGYVQVSSAQIYSGLQVTDSQG